MSSGVHWRTSLQLEVVLGKSHLDCCVEFSYGSTQSDRYLFV